MPPSMTSTTLISRPESETELEPVQFLKCKPKLKLEPRPTYKTLWGYFEHEIKWFNVFFWTLVHLYIIKVYSTINFDTWHLSLWGIIYGSFGGFGVTAGAHRYFTHRCYKANLPMRIILMLAFSSAGQNTIYEWVRDHRVHHKFSETDADPHNSKRGFFFAHCGWLLMKKHPEVIRRGKTVDCSDVLEDPVVQFHQKYFHPLRILMCYVVPIALPMYFLGWNFWECFDAAFGKWVTLLHCTWAVNSAAHLWGTKPYNKDICPVEIKAVSFLAMGEGWHNYHHTFPWDYKAAELSYHWNVTTFWIDVFAKIGWAYDLKQPSKELVEAVVRRSGDGTHFKWGHDAVEENDCQKFLCGKST